MKTTKEKEHYIKEIYKLIENNKKVSVSSLSFTLGVSKSSVTNMLKKLVKMQLVDTAPYKPITLTIDGKKVAELVSPDSFHQEGSFTKRFSKQELGLAAGTYFLEFKSKDFTSTNKFTLF